MKTLDYCVMAIYLIGLVSMGWYVSRKERGTEDYLLGGHSIPYWALAMSMFATLFSALSFLGVPSEAYGNGCRMFLAVLIAPFALYLAVRLFMRFYFTLGTFTPYEYLERRFSPSVRLSASILFLFQRGCYLSLILYASSIAFQSICGWSPIFTICLVGGVSMIFTVYGGIKAVVWTDVLQVIVIFGGLLVVMFRLGMLIPGGIGDGLAYAFEHGRGFRLDATFFSFNPYERITFWLLAFSTVGTYFFSFSADQLNVQRILATKTYGEARKASYMSWIVGIPNSILLYMTGILLFSFFALSPDASAWRELRPDLAFPTFIANFLPSPLPGILLSALLSAIISTVDSGMNSLSAIFVKDIYKRFIKCNASEHEELRVARWATFAVGVFMIVMAVFISTLNEASTTTIFEATSIWSAIVLMLTVIYLLGVTTERVSGRQINILLVLALPVVVLASWFLYYNVEPDNRISFTITGNLGGLFVLLGGYACALFSRRSPGKNVNGLTLWTLREPSSESKKKDEAI